MSAHKPLTEKQWRQFIRYAQKDGNGPYLLSDEDMRRIHATIEAGGFAPEPITDLQLRAWLYAGSIGADSREYFSDSDVAAAMRAANSVGLDIALDNRGMHGAGWTVRSWSRDFEVGSQAKAARIITALVYAKEHPDADVSHLLGDQ